VKVKPLVVVLYSDYSDIYVDILNNQTQPLFIVNGASLIDQSGRQHADTFDSANGNAIASHARQAVALEWDGTTLPLKTQHIRLVLTLISEGSFTHEVHIDMPITLNG
jgi:hypothetical protein